MPPPPPPSAPAVSRQRNQRGEGGRLKDEIIEAAMRILDRGPVTDLSLRMVAREAGIAAPSIYPHFKDAQTMIGEIVRDCWRQVGDAMSAAAADCGGDVCAVLQARLGAYVRYAMDRPSRYQLLFALQPFDTEALRDLPGLVMPASRNILDSVEAMQRAGYRLPATDAMDVTVFILSLAHGRVALAHTAPHREGNSSDRVEHWVWTMICNILNCQVRPPSCEARICKLTPVRR